jgi:hypothetical protein
VPDLNDIRELVRKKLRAAADAATLMRLKENAKHYQREGDRLSLISDIPRFSILPDGYGVQTWATILFVDLRNSSDRAERHGPRTTYLLSPA